ncbi:hypothetical protein FSP39_000093, partial [Pinctada imbricata]
IDIISQDQANIGSEGKNLNDSCSQDGKIDWKGYTIPKTSPQSSSDEEGEFSDPFQHDNQSDCNQDDSDRSSDDLNKSQQEDDGSEEEGPTRFDPLSEKKSFKLDRSKEKYAQKYFNRHLTDEMIQSSILQSALIPANSFLTPPKVDEYIEDLVNDNKVMRFLRMHDASLKHVQKRIAQCMGPMAKVWHELDSINTDNPEQNQSSMDIFDVKELMEKCILMLGQANASCLYERRMNFLAKIMQSTKKAKSALKENDQEFKGGEQLFGKNFYSVQDRKAKSRKRAREMSRDMKGEPPAKRPFRPGPPGKPKANPRGSNQKGFRRSGPSDGRRGAQSKTNSCVTFFARSRSIFSMQGKKYNTVSFVSNANNKRGFSQSPRGSERSEFRFRRSVTHSFGRKARPFSHKLGENYIRSGYFDSNSGVQNRFHGRALSGKSIKNESIRKRPRNSHLEITEMLEK